MSRFSQSANNFYSTLSNNRPSTGYKGARGRMMSSTLETFQPLVSGTQMRPQTGTFMRASSSSFRNTKSRLQILSERLTLLLNQCQQTRTDTKELQLQHNLLKQDLNARGIDPIYSELTQKIKGLDKAIRIRERSDKLKFQVLNQTCQALDRNSRDIKGKIYAVSNKLREVQNMLGFHGVRDRLKY